MPVLLVEPLSEKAYELLRQLEELHILRVITTPGTSPNAADYGSKLSKSAGGSLSRHAQQVRGEWGRGF